MFLMPFLVVIWLSITCQNCFASEKPVVEKSHACCPSMQTGQEQVKQHHHETSKACKSSCTIHTSQQSDIHDGFSLEKQFVSLGGPSRSYGSDYLARHRAQVYPHRIEPLHYPSVFESYRVLLI